MFHIQVISPSFHIIIVHAYHQSHITWIITQFQVQDFIQDYYAFHTALLIPCTATHSMPHDPFQSIPHSLNTIFLLFPHFALRFMIHYSLYALFPIAYPITHPLPHYSPPAPHYSFHHYSLYISLFIPCHFTHFMFQYSSPVMSLIPHISIHYYLYRII